MKKLIALLLALISLFTLSVAASAADISEARAKEIALADAGIAANAVATCYAHIDYDDGVKVWDIEFTVASDNGYTEYDYELKAADGSIREKSSERKTGTAPVQGDTVIGKDAAFANAQKAFGVTGGKLLENKLDTDDGIRHYEIEFRTGMDTKYSCDVNAYNGEVYDMETEKFDNIFRKLELLFDILESLFSNMFTR